MKVLMCLLSFMHGVFWGTMIYCFWTINSNNLYMMFLSGKVGLGLAVLIVVGDIIVRSVNIKRRGSSDTYI